MAAGFGEAPLWSVKDRERAYLLFGIYLSARQAMRVTGPESIPPRHRMLRVTTERATTDVLILEEMFLPPITILTDGMDATAGPRTR